MHVCDERNSAGCLAAGTEPVILADVDREAAADLLKLLRRCVRLGCGKCALLG